jgi:hypothetical protein
MHDSDTAIKASSHSHTGGTGTENKKNTRIGKHDLQEIELLRRSIDARKKSELKYVYQLDVK